MAQQTAALIVKKKKWVPVLATELFSNLQIGELYLEFPEQAVGRQVTVSLMTLIGDPQRQSVQATFDIKDCKDGILHTELIKYHIVPSAVKKMLRRGKNKLEDSFSAVSKDGKKLRVKTVMITRGKATHGVHHELRKRLVEILVKTLSEQNFVDFINDLLTKKTQKTCIALLSKTYPLQMCEVRYIGIVPEKKEPEKKA